MTIRGDMLDKAKRITEKERKKAYGDPEINMLNFAALLEAYLEARGNPTKLDAQDAAWIMVLAKIARTVGRKAPHEDNYVDAAAYAAIAGECAVLMYDDDTDTSSERKETEYSAEYIAPFSEDFR